PMNPVLVVCMGAGYLFNFYRKQPVLRKGGVLILMHPTRYEFDAVQHPSYIDFYDEVLADTKDPGEIEKRYELRFAEDPWFRQLPERHPPAHPADNALRGGVRPMNRVTALAAALLLISACGGPSGGGGGGGAQETSAETVGSNSSDFSGMQKCPESGTWDSYLKAEQEKDASQYETD